MPNPYKPKSKKDEQYRKQMYADSSALYKDNPKYMDKTTIKSFSTKNFSPNYFKKNSKTVSGEAAFVGKDKGSIHKYDENVQVLNHLASDKILPIQEGIGTEYEYGRPTQGFVYKKPTQKVESFQENNKLKPRKIKAEIQDSSLPDTLSTIDVPEFKATNQKITRQVAGIDTIPSDKKGYENMPEYNRFKRKEPIDVPRSAVKATYAKGTRKIKVKELQKAGSGLNDVAVPEAGDMGNVLSSGLSMGATGAELGGPWGAAAGAVGGIAMGLFEKDQQDKLHNQAVKINKDNKMNRRFDGVDTTINQKQQTYAKGSVRMKRKKAIEVEGGEHHFDENLNHKGVYQGASHKEGGIDTVVEEGDSIIPKKHKKTVDKALKAGDYQKIDKIRKSLPKDVQGKASDGDWMVNQNAYAKRNTSITPVRLNNGQALYADDANRKGQYDFNRDITNGAVDSYENLPQGHKDNPFPYAVNRVKATGTMYRNDGVAPLPNSQQVAATTGIANQISSIPKPGELQSPIAAPSSGSATTDASEEGNPVGNIGKYANVANNLLRSFQKPKSPEESYLDPELLKYTDRSETLRQASRQGQRVQDANARNSSGGMVGNLRANQAASNIENLTRQEGINETEMQRADAVDNTNVSIKNDAKKTNLLRKDMYQDQMMKGRAVQDSYGDTAAKEIADLGNIAEQNKFQRMRDAKDDQFTQQDLNLRNQMYKYKGSFSGDNADVSFNSNTATQGGSVTPLGNNKTTSKVSIDKNGKQSTSTTVSSGGSPKLRSRVKAPFKRK